MTVSAGIYVNVFSSSFQVLFTTLPATSQGSTTYAFTYSVIG